MVWRKVEQSIPVCWYVASFSLLYPEHSLPLVQPRCTHRATNSSILRTHAWSNYTSLFKKEGPGTSSLTMLFIVPCCKMAFQLEFNYTSHDMLSKPQIKSINLNCCSWTISLFIGLVRRFLTIIHTILPFFFVLHLVQIGTVGYLAVTRAGANFIIASMVSVKGNITLTLVSPN